MFITAQMLREKGASCSQVAAFEKEWPKGGKTTLKNLQRAAALNLGLRWFAYHFLSASAWAEYEKAAASALYKAIKQSSPKD